jgi:hypothetical protein
MAITLRKFNNFPIEVVTELLGPLKLSIAYETYGKIVQKKVGEEMRRLNEKLE